MRVSALCCRGEEVLMGLNLLKAANGSSPAVAWWVTQEQGWAWGWSSEAVSLSCIPGGTCLCWFFGKYFKDCISSECFFTWQTPHTKMTEQICQRPESHNSDTRLFISLNSPSSFKLSKCTKREFNTASACSCGNEKEGSGPERFPCVCSKLALLPAHCFPAQGLMLRKAFWAQSSLDSFCAKLVTYTRD